MAEKCNKSEAFSHIVKLSEERSEGRPFVIAIDGRSASGKTTFAKKLAEAIGAQIIHTDDFCRPRDSLGNLNVSEFEGNFDLERFKREVVDNLNSKNGFSYSVFNCKKGCFTETVQIKPFSPIIIEGAYSLCKKFGDYADIKVFFDVSADMQKKRIAIRNGEKALNSFLSLWIPAEERYFAHYNILKFCDYLITEEENGNLFV